MDTIGKLRKVFIAFVAAGLVACGGGGNSGPAPAVYSGITDPAKVDNGNSKPFNETASIGSGSGSGIGGVFSAAQNNSSDRNNLKAFAKSFRNITKSLDVKNTNPGSQDGLAAAINDSIQGDCGGSMSFNINYDENTHVFSGNISFNNLNDCDSTINGSVSFSGTLVPSSESMSGFKMSFNAVSFTDSDASMTMTGDITLTSLSINQDRMVMNMDFRNNNTNVTYRVQNLSILETTNGSVEITVVESGRVYHPEYGYVTVSTPTPIETNVSDQNPSSGVLLMVGDASSATVTYLDSNNYTIQIDHGNDGGRTGF